MKEGGSLMLNNVSITSETGSGLATEGGSIDAENVKIYKCKNHGRWAFGNQLEEPKSGRVTLENVAISNCGGDGILLRGGVEVDSRDVKIDNCAGFGIEAFENVQRRDERRAKSRSVKKETLAAITTTTTATALALN